MGGCDHIRHPGREVARFARFMEDAQITAQLDHPSIIPIHELGEDEESWSPNTAGFILQATTRLENSQWSNTPGGSVSPVRIGAGGLQMFYRLTKPWHRDPSRAVGKTAPRPRLPFNSRIPSAPSGAGRPRFLHGRLQ